jgi:2-polyprenyl-6-methoxyphenol hydroxylase-like FAD-dependent oxidoreductase
VSPRPVAPVVIVGAGPVGLTLALRLADLGVASRVLEAGSRLDGEGSKALCMQRETLESWCRLGFGEEVAARGVAWQLGRTYYRGRELFQTRFPAVGRDHFPPFVNISQSGVEQLMVARAEADPLVEIAWEHRVTGLEQSAREVVLTVQGSAGTSTVRGPWVVATDGARSAVRGMLGVDFPGHSHGDRFLIADIRADLPFPDERRFYFDPPWNPGRTVLVHPQPDSVWRIDWQVPADFDLELERESGRLDERIRRIVGDSDYALVWLTVYRFHQRIADRLRSGRVFLAGDAAHLMSPFGARGLNSGVGDAENLAWKLALVLTGAAPETLLDTYDVERRAAALENLAVTDATMRFMVPAGRRRRLVRNAVLHGSRWSRRVRARVDSGRLATPYVYTASPIVAATSPGPVTDATPVVGAVAPDGPCTVLFDGRQVAAGSAPVRRLRQLLGRAVLGLVIAPTPDHVHHLIDAAPQDVPLVVVVPAGTPGAVVASAAAGGPARQSDGLHGGTGSAPVLVVRDDEGVLAAAYAGDGLPPAGRLLVVRPDLHLAARRDLGEPGDLKELAELGCFAAGATLRG